MPKNSTKFIIGGGITGLVWGFYNPDFQIISPEVGGQFSKKYLVLLHDTAETRQLLKDLGWEKPEQFADDCKIGYFHNYWIKTVQTPEMNLSMIQKKMTEWNKPVDTKFVPKTRDLSTTSISGSNYLKILNVDLGEVINRLQGKSTILNGMVTGINKDQITVKSGEEILKLNYDKLVTSIPAPIFWEMWGEKKDFKSLPTTNVETKIRPPFYDDDFDMIYYDDKFKYSRISKIDGKYIIEFTGVITKEQFIDMYKCPVENLFVVKHGRIFSNTINTPPPKVIFSGRFSQWEYGITSEHIIKQCLDYKNYAA